MPLFLLASISPRYPSHGYLTLVDLTHGMNSDCRQLHNAIVETVREPLLVLSPDLRVITANRSFYSNFLVTPEETENEFIYDLGDRRWNMPELRNLLEKVLPEDKAFSDLEIELELPNIGRRVMILNARKIYLKEPYVKTTLNTTEPFYRLILLAIEDITERKQIEEALLKSNAFNQSIIDSSHDCIKLLDLEGRLQYMSPGGRRQLGIQDMGKYLNVPYQEFWKSSEDHQSALEAIHQAQQGQMGTFRGYCPTVDGTPKWWDVVITAVVGADGNPERLLAVSRDITERKQNEEALRLSKEHYRSLFENMVEGFAYCRMIFKDTRPQDFIYLEVNSAFDKLTGLKNVVGRKVTEVIPGIRESNPELFDIYGRVALTGKPERFELYLKPLEAYFSISVYSTEREHFVAVFDDITLRKTAEEAIRKLNEDLQRHALELERAYKDMESFSYSVSHDLRAPLRIIDAMSDIVLKDYYDKLNDEGKHLLRSIRGNTKRMDQLVLALLDLSKAGRKEMEIAEIDMEKEASLIVADLKALTPERNITVHFRELPPARGDLTLIRQVLTNLLSNAVKFTKDRNIADIEVGCRREDGENVYYVKDNGAGFDMEFADKLFKVFQRLHSLKEFEGVGIGLSIVDRIIKRHGGRVWAAGRPAEGATFYFTVPRKEE